MLSPDQVEARFTLSFGYGVLNKIVDKVVFIMRLALRNRHVFEDLEAYCTLEWFEFNKIILLRCWHVELVALEVTAM